MMATLRHMSFAALILKNLLRQRVRTGLTLLGISLGIATVVALGVITESMNRSVSGLLRVRDSDFLVAQKGTADLSFSVISEDEWRALEARPDVARAIGVALHMAQMGTNPFFFVMGLRYDQLAANLPSIESGRMYADQTATEIMLGTRAVDDLGLGVGDGIVIDNTEFQVVGIYRTGDIWQDGGAFVPLALAQQMAKRSGYVTAVYITAAEGVGAHALAERIRAEHPTVTTVSDISEMSQVDQGPRLLNAANLAISALAVIIGAIGVMNTMAMSVFERTREFGVLRAIGWRGNRLLRMILGEAIVLCVVAAAVGSLLGVMASQAMLLIPAVKTFLLPQYTVDIFVRGLGVAVVVAVMGAAYPAYRAVRLTPIEALRYE